MDLMASSLHTGAVITGEAALTIVGRGSVSVPVSASYPPPQVIQVVGLSIDNPATAPGHIPPQPVAAMSIGST